jgi:DNA-3-methyladenine glycosylase
MLERRKQTTISPKLTAGPARLTQALGIHTTQSATALNGQLFGISAPKIPIADKQLHTTSRIGIEYAKEDAKLPWRVYLKDSKWISHP